MTSLRTVEDVAERIASQMDGRTVTSHEHYRSMLEKELVYELSKRDLAISTALVEALEGEYEAWVPDDKAFMKHGTTERLKNEYNRGLDTALDIIKQLLESKN